MSCLRIKNFFYLKISEEKKKDLIFSFLFFPLMGRCQRMSESDCFFKKMPPFSLSSNAISLPPSSLNETGFRRERRERDFCFRNESLVLFLFQALVLRSFLKVAEMKKTVNFNYLFMDFVNVSNS